MLNVLLVDDSLLELEALQQTLDWNAFGMCIVGCVTSATAALEICQRDVPDLVITDLIMPGENGLSLAKQLRNNYKDIHIILISGYEDFVTAQNAMELQMDGYLLKPLDPDQLRELVQKITGQVFESRLQKSEQHRMEQLVHEASSLLKERFWLNLLLSNNPMDLPMTIHQARMIGIPIRDQRYLVLVFRYAAFAQMDALLTPSLMLHELQSITPYDAVRVTQELYAAVVPISPIVEEIVATETIEQFAAQLIASQTGEQCVTIGASLMGNFPDIPNLFRQARQALSYSFRYGSNHLYWYDEIEITEDSSLMTVRTLLRHLDDALSSTDTNEVSALLDRLFDVLKPASPHVVQSVCFELISCALNHFHRFGLSPQKLIGSDTHLWEKLLHPESILDMHQWMKNVLLNFTISHEEQHKGAGKTAVNKLLKVIENDYMNDLSLAELAQRVNLAPGYMCRVFKNSTGKSIAATLLDTRMRQAQRMLLDGYKVYQVAAATGYSSDSYFIKVFREYTGKTPKDFCKNEH